MASKFTDAEIGSVSVRRQLDSVGMEGNPDKLRETYNTISEHYDKYAAETYRVADKSLAKAIAVEMKDTNASILDVCAGTGLLGKQLKERGFTDIDALDFSQGMLDLAKSKGIYKNFICARIQTEEKTEIEDNTYDVVCMSGGMFVGHLAPNVLPELTRMTIRGGIIAFDITETISKTYPEYGEDAMETTCESLIADGKWVKWTMQTAPFYAGNPGNGQTGENSSIYIATVA